jgi:hypothetical protein
MDPGRQIPTRLAPSVQGFAVLQTEDAVYDERVMFLGDWYHTYSSVLLNQYMGNDRPRSY